MLSNLPEGLIVSDMTQELMEYFLFQHIPPTIDLRFMMVVISHPHHLRSLPRDEPL